MRLSLSALGVGARSKGRFVRESGGEAICAVAAEYMRWPNRLCRLSSSVAGSAIGMCL